MAELSSPATHPGSRSAFRFTNQILNPIIKWVLRSRFGRRLGRRLALVTYQGRRTTARHEFVAMYARVGDVVWILPGQPEKKVWWKNFRSPGTVELLLAGELVRGTAKAIDGGLDPEAVAVGMDAYLQTFPRLRKTIEKNGRDSQEVARRTVIVRVQLDS
jgi:hypothetical protein